MKTALDLIDFQLLDQEEKLQDIHKTRYDARYQHNKPFMHSLSQWTLRGVH